MSDYKYISNEFKYRNHYWKATDEVCSQGRDYICLRRTGYTTELSNLPPNTGLTTRIVVHRDKIKDKL